MPYMRYQSNDSSNGQHVGFLAGCLAGMVIGVALGVLIAPHRGDITRRKIIRKAGETRDQVEDLTVHRRDDEDGDDEEADS